MRKYFLSPAATLFLFQLSLAQVNVQNLLCENLKNPVGIDAQQPRLSWQLSADRRNVYQTAYEIRVSSSPAFKDILWSSKNPNSNHSVHVQYAGKSLESGRKYYWQVRVTDDQQKISPWSEPASWQMGLLKPGDWKAEWITVGFIEDSVNRPSPLFRKSFSIARKKIASATAYITAHGMYEATINGKRIGDAYLTPGWTSYKKRLQYQAYDVTHLLKAGGNVVAATLGSGWYRGVLAWNNNKNIYGKDISLLLQIDITFADGTRDQVWTNQYWKTSTGSIKYSEIYHGETIDARDEKTGWNLPGYDDSGWSDAVVLPFSKENLIATINEPIKKHETFKPKRIITTPKGEHVIDFGQNLVGWVIVKAKGKPGDTITIRHAEVLDKFGNFYVENLRIAKSTNHFILKGNGTETFEPHFTFHGFRYIQVNGVNGPLNPDDFTAVALYSAMKPTGSFTSSNPLINQLQHNIQWGQKGNFLDVPTDCPQRDERLGWTGDAQVFSRTAAFNMQVNNFFAKWLKDVAADQTSAGGVPFVVPNVLGDGASSSAGWADAATIIPWDMYRIYGDKEILEDQYPSMKRWVDYMAKASKNDLWNTGFHFGDWLFYRPADDNDGRAAVTDKYLIAQCFYAHSTQLLINAARVLGKNDDVTSYSSALQRIKDAFLREYTTSSGRLVSGTQTAYVLALNFDMLPESQRKQAAERLAENVKGYGNHLTTGFLGTPYLCQVLTRYGHEDLAFKLLLQETYPSWLYPVKMGATTIWERWDGQKPDSTFQTPGMNSFNHYAYGAIGDWMYKDVAGLDTYDDGVGYRHIKIQPHIGGGLSHAAASYESYYGKIRSGWTIENNKLVLEIEIPANTKATVHIPTKENGNVMEGGMDIQDSKDVKVRNREGKYVVVVVGSGKYRFVADM